MAIRPRWYTDLQRERDRQRYPELEFSDPDELLRIDAASMLDGSPLTSFGQTALDTFARQGVSPEDQREIENETRRDLSFINEPQNYLEGFRRGPQYTPSPVELGTIQRQREIDAETPQSQGGTLPTPVELAQRQAEKDDGGNGLLNFANRAYQLSKRSPIAGNVIGTPEAIVNQGRSLVNLATGLARGEVPEIDPLGQLDSLGATVLDQARSANPPTAALDLFRDRERPATTVEGLVGLLSGFQDIDTVTGLPIRTQIRQGSQALTDPAQALREQFAQEQQGGIGFGLEGAAPFETLRGIPGIEKDIPGTELSAFDTILGVSDALLDAGSLYGVARSGPLVRTYQRLTAGLPAGLSLRNIGPDINILKGTLGLPADATDAAVIAAAQQARMGIRATSLSTARGPEAVQLAQQQLELIDGVLKNLPPPGAIPSGVVPTQLGAQPGQDLFVAIDRNTGRYVQHSNRFTNDIDEATRFLDAGDAQRFAAAQPYPVDLFSVSRAGDELGAAVTRETPLVPRPAPQPRPSLTAPEAELPPVRRPTSLTFDPSEGQPQRSVQSVESARRAAEPPPLPPQPRPSLAAPEVDPPPVRRPIASSFDPFEGQPQRSVKAAEPPRRVAPPLVPFKAIVDEGPSIQMRMPFADDLTRMVDDVEAVSLGRQALRTTSDIINLPRAVMSSIDHSFPGRQGIPFITRTDWWKAWGPSLRAWVPQQWDDYATTRLDQLLGGPQTRAAAEAGDAGALEDLVWAARKEQYGLSQVAFGELGQKLSARAEGFVSRIADDIPGINASQRAYVTFGNELRDGVFRAAYEKASRLVADGTWTVAQRDEHMREISKWINEVTGRADLPQRVLESDILAASNALIFSPRNFVSRFQVLGNILRAAYPKSSLTRQMRAEIARDFAGYVGLGTLGLYMLDRAGWVEVEWDSRSVDFAKGRIPLTGQRYDPWAGFQPIARYLTQIGRGETKSAITGEVSDIEGNFFERTGDLGYRFVRGKYAPIPSLVVDLMSGETAIGEPVQPEDMGTGGFWVDRFMPLSANDIYTGMRAEGTAGAIKALPAIVGIGFNQYQGPADVLDAVSLRDYGVPFKNLDNPIAREVVRDSPEYRAAQAAAETARGGDEVTRDEVSQAFDLYRTAKTRNEDELAALLKAGISGEALREAISDFKGDNYESGQALFGGKIGDYLDANDDEEEGIKLLAEQYWSAPVPETVTESGDLHYNFDVRDEHRDAILREMQRLGLGEDTIVYTNPATGRTVSAIDYVLGTGEGTYRGVRYDDPTVRQAVADYERFQQRLDDTGYFDLRDEAWIAFREQHGDQLGHITDYWAWREAEELEISQGFIDQGDNAVSARRRAKDEVNGYQTVSLFNEFYRKEFRHSWVVGNRDLALSAVEFGYLDPDGPEGRFLSDVEAPQEPTTQRSGLSSAIGSAIRPVFGR